MKVSALISERRLNKKAHMDLVYEWEDIFAENMNLQIETPSFFYVFINRLCIKINFDLLWVFRNKTKLMFILRGNKTRSDGYNSKKIIPFIIDFFEKQEDLKLFYEGFKRHKIILISSLEVFEFLKNNVIPVPRNTKLYHLPLSIPDGYRIDQKVKFNKKYDLVLLGRQDPILEEYVKNYSLKNPGFVYVYRIMEKEGFKYYNSKNELLGFNNSRDFYFELMKASKVGLYSTRGLSEAIANGYNQVTPRFFELLTSGCHVLARYPKNPDTDFFCLKEFSESIESYDQFEEKMDYALTHEVDIKKYSSYLNQHYTSKRVEQLRLIIG
jgi:hypothetical protein